MSFAKHQTFYLREGWLFKGMRAIRDAEIEGEQPTIFLDKDAPERLGIGRNMVYALRFWMQATGLATEQYEGRSVQRLTPFGQLVWEHDRYLEDDVTLWLLHYQLVCSREHATSWYWFFNHFSPTSFNDQTACNALQQWVTTIDLDRSIAVSSLKKDIACLLRTYLPDEKKRSPEDVKQSPLAQLRILARTTGQEKRYYWQRANLAHLHPLAVLYVLQDRQEKSLRKSNQLHLRDALYEPMNVGRVFNITTAGVTEMINLLKRDYYYNIDFVRTAHLDQITLPSHTTASAILERYYAEEHTTIGTVQ